MSWNEYVGNLHVHTVYSDGEATHAQIGKAAQLAGLDFVVFTDHNLWLNGIEGYYGDEESGHVLFLCGQEVHDRERSPGGNHVLVYGAEDEMANSSYDLANLLERVSQLGGLSFMAHPDDQAVDWLGEPALPWIDRYVEGYTGLEIWNYMSRFKDHLQTRSRAVRHVFRPEEVMDGPSPQTLALWDELLALGQQVVGIGGADAHGTHVSLGPVTHTVFPYDFLFSCVNTHVITRFPLNGVLEHDKQLLYQALSQGRAFIGYEILGSTRGFRYTAQGQSTSAIMGEYIRLGHGVTLQVFAPSRAHIKIIYNGQVLAEESNVENLTLVVREPGAYRAEVWRPYAGRERAWILSNPIYVSANPSARLHI